MIIDLSVNVENTASEPLPVKIDKTTNAKGARSFGRKIIWSKRTPILVNVKNAWKFLSGTRRLVSADFPDEEFLSLEMIRLSTHTGTHVDAPAHFGTTCAGQMAKKIDELPLDWFVGDGVVLDLTHKRGGSFITRGDIKECLGNIQYKLKERDIVLIFTGTDKKWKTPAYFFDAPGMSAEATEYIIDQGVKVIGIDTYGFDRPINRMVDDFFESRNSKMLWPAHFLGRKKEYVHIERLCNLDQIPVPYGFKVHCLPIKISNVDASWTRAVAILN